MPGTKEESPLPRHLINDLWNSTISFYLNQFWHKHAEKKLLQIDSLEIVWHSF